MITEALQPSSEQLHRGEPRYINFKGVSIQWDKGQWEFNHPQLGRVVKDTYSIWNPEHWPEIARRLDKGQLCAAYIMGNFGGVLKGEAPGWQDVSEDKIDVMYDKVKKRPRTQNMVVFAADPDDILGVIDIGRVKEPFRKLRWADNRANSYAGPQHNIFPLSDNNLVNEGFIRKADNTIACFSIPGHWGYEGLGREARKIIKHGLLGGSSLNVHGNEPEYTKDGLYNALSKNPEWLEEVDMILLDEIAEAAQIGRSQSMVSFTGEEAEMVRQGSLSPEYISEKTGISIRPASGMKQASYIPGAADYTPEDNVRIDKTVEETIRLMAEYKQWFKENNPDRKSSFLSIIRNMFPHQGPKAPTAKAVT